MSKKPFDLILTEKEPIVFFSKSIIKMDDGELVAYNKLGRFPIQPASTLVIFLGAGTSITQEAAIFCALHDCVVAFSRGESYVHSIWHSGRWSDPISIVNQALLQSDDIKRLQLAKNITKKRMINEYSDDFNLNKIDNATSINQLLGYEANWAKSIYKKEAELSKISFKRDFNGLDDVNMRLNLLNNALYSLTTAIIISTGLHPSIGFIHGKSRRGGLSFDLADIYKYKLTIKPAFRMPSSMKFQEIMFYFSKDIKENNFKIIKEMVDICLKIGEGNIEI